MQRTAGTARHTTGVIVIDNPKITATFSELVYELYESLEKGLAHPIGRKIVQRKAKRYAGEKNLRVAHSTQKVGRSTLS